MARIFLERREPADDTREMLTLIGDEEWANGIDTECVPAMDVVETTSAIEVLMDLPGVPLDSLKVAFIRDTLVVAGRKLAAACEHKEAAFHLAERAFGRFARAVRLDGAFDPGRARATLSCGELRIVLPRIDERRGGEIRIPITAA